MAKKRFKPKQVAEALREANGLVTYAARRLGATRKTVYNYINEYPEVKEAHEDARDFILDRAESVLLGKVGQGDLTATIFLLKTLGKNRGYSERFEHTGSDGEQIKVTIQYENDNDYN